MLKNEEGKQYGIWLVGKRTFPNYAKNGTATWACKCLNCGNVHTYTGNTLRFDHYGKCKKCGRKV